MYVTHRKLLILINQLENKKLDTLEKTNATFLELNSSSLEKVDQFVFLIKSLHKDMEK